jgi:O-antigen/teichoic acid export membrane protein
MLKSNRVNKRVSVARGAVLVVAMRWTDRLIGLVSTLILARLLLPEDFGIVAMASIVVGLIDTLLDLGVGSALVQNKHAGREEFDTAWTFRLLQAAFAALLIWLAAPFAAEYFRDPRVIDVIKVMALAVLIGGFENIGIVAFQKNMEFGRDFQFFFFRRVAGFVVTIALAFWLKSYWAMVIGAVVGRTVGVAISYGMHDYRPRLSIVRFRQLWSFSQWILVGNIGTYGLMQIDKFLVGRRTDAATMGSYSLADDIAAMPTTELLSPLSRVLFPLFVDTAHDPEKLRVAFCKAIGVQTLLALPAGVGLCMVASDAVLLLLGERWQQAIPLVQTLALISVFSALTYSSSYLLLALGRVSLQALLSWLRFGMLAFLVIVVFPDAGVRGIANIRLATTALGFMLFVWLVLHYVESVRLRDFVEHSWRPLLSTGIMALSLGVFPRFESLALFVQVFLSVAFGAGVYVCSILVLWRVSGCRDGGETYLLEQLHMKDRVVDWMRFQK